MIDETRMKAAKANVNISIFNRFRFKNGENKGRKGLRSEPCTDQNSTFKVKKDENGNFINENSTESVGNGCIKLTSVKADKKANDTFKEFEAHFKPSPPLPMVKFDSEGDFSKELIKSEIVNKDLGKSSMRIKKIVIDPQKLEQYLKKTLKLLFSQIGLLVLVLGYVIFGAFLFMQIESSYEKEIQVMAEKNREDFFESIKISAEAIFNEYLKKNFHVKYTLYRTEEMILKDSETIQESINIILNQLSKISNASNPESTPIAVVFDKPSISFNKQKCSWCIEIDKKKFNPKIKEHLNTLLHENDKIEDKDKANMLVREEVWNFPNAALYAFTVITTIGYGNITPKSILGKICTIVYALLGIPLLFLMLSNMSDLVADLFINSYSKCIRFFYRRLCKHKLKMPYSVSKFHENKKEMLNEFEIEYDNPNDRHVPVLVTVAVLIACNMAGALIFKLSEDWSLLDGVYFCFITFTTIGFGDLVPGKGTMNMEKGGTLILCCMYLLFGLVINAMCIKLMQDEVIASVKSIGRKLGIIEK